jgi:hypothetical protein
MKMTDLISKCNYLNLPKYNITIDFNLKFIRLSKFFFTTFFILN